MKSFFKILTVLLISIASTRTEAQTIIYVDGDVTGTGDGQSWSTAYKYLQDALINADSSDQIWIKAGTYFTDEGTGIIDNDNQADFFIPSGVKLFGGFSGSETSLEERDWKQNLTVLNGDIDQNDTYPSDDPLLVESISGTNALHVVRLADASPGTELNGLFITGGSASGGQVKNQYGGGIYIEGSNHSCDPVLKNLWIQGNYASQRGGGFSTYQVTGNFGEFGIILENVTFKSNSSGNGGGGAYNYAITPQNNKIQYINCRFENNISDLRGAAVYTFAENSGTLTTDYHNNVIVNNELLNNNGSAAAIYNFTSSGRVEGTINNCTIYGNFRPSSSLPNPSGIYFGRQFDAGDCIFTVSNSIFWDNQWGVNIQTLSGLTLPKLSNNIIEHLNSISYTDLGGNIDNDPLLKPDFSIDTLSPAFNAGDENYLIEDVLDSDQDGNFIEKYPYDIAGTQRIKGDIDIGAFEVEYDGYLFGENIFFAHPGDQQVHIHWKLDEGLSYNSIRLYRNESLIYESLAQDADTFFLDQNLTNQTQYQYKLAIIDLEDNELALDYIEHVVPNSSLGNSAYFDGDADYIHVEHNNLLNPAQGTIEFWVKIKEVPSGNGYSIASKHQAAGSSNGWNFEHVSNEFLVNMKGSSANKIFTGVNLIDSTWHHIAYTYDISGEGEAIIYVDGDSLVSIALPSINLADEPVRLGSSPDSYWEDFKGEIDEFRIWNYIKSETEIQQNMDQRVDGSEEGLLLALNLDEPKGSTIAYDNSPNNFDGNLFGDVQFMLNVPVSLEPLATGPIKESYSLNGAVDGSIKISIENDTFSRDTLVYAVDYELDSIPQGLTPLLLVKNAGDTAVLTFSGNAIDHSSENSINNLRITFFESAFTNLNEVKNLDLGSGIEFSDNEMYLNAGDDQVKIYWKVKDTTDVNYFALLRTGLDSTRKQITGYVFDFKTDTFNVFIDDDVKNGLVYKYEIDVGNYSYEEQLFGADVAIPNKNFANSASFDGDDDYILINDQPQYKGTIEFWTKISEDPGPPNNHFIIASKHSSNSAENGWSIYQDLTSINIQVKSSTETYNLNSNSNIIDDNWHHIAFSYDFTGTEPSIFFLDGDSITSSIINVDSLTMNPLYLGHSQGSFWTDFKGQIDEFRVWQYPLTMNEIRNNMNKRSDGSEDSLLLVLNLDEPSFNTWTNDGGIHNINGKIIGEISSIPTNQSSYGPYISYGNAYRIDDGIKLIDQLDLSDDISFPTDLQINPNGMYMNIVEGNEKILFLHFERPYDFSSLKFVSHEKLGENVQAIAFDNSGVKAYAVDRTKGIIQYNTYGFLASDYYVDIEVDGFDISDKSNDPVDITISHEGFLIHVLDKHSKNIYQYRLNLPFDMRGGVNYEGSYSFESEDRFPSHISFSDDGFKLLMLGHENQKLFQYSLNEPFDITREVTFDSVTWNLNLDIIESIAFDASGTYMYTVSSTSETISKYEIIGNHFNESAQNDGSIDDFVRIRINSDTFSVKNDVLSEGLYSIENLPFGYTPRFEIDSTSKNGKLFLEGQHSDHQLFDSLNHLTFTFNSQSFGSDNSLVFNSINHKSSISIKYRNNPLISFGDPLKNAEFSDFEFSLYEKNLNGTSFFIDPSGTRFYLAHNHPQYEIREYRLESPYNFDSLIVTENTLPTGSYVHFTISDDGHNVYISNYSSHEIIKHYYLDSAWDLSTATLKAEISDFVSELYFSPSGVFFNPTGTSFIVLSKHLSYPKLYQFELSTPYDISSIIEYSSVLFPYEVENVTSIFLSRDGKRIFATENRYDDLLMFDLSVPFEIKSLRSKYQKIQAPTGTRIPHYLNLSGEYLYLSASTLSGDNIYKINVQKDGFNEHPMNDGRVTGYLDIRLTDGTFSNPSGQLIQGQDYNIENTPSGLVPVLQVSNNGKSALLTFDGVAAEHEATNSLDNLIFSFNNSAFADAEAVNVINATSASSNLGITFNDNSSPVFFTSDSISIMENKANPVLDVNATNGESDEFDYFVSYSIKEEDDYQLFQINETNGQLSFISSPDYEAPDDANSDNFYQIIIIANDGSLTSEHVLTIEVTNKNDNAPEILPDQTFTIDENGGEGLFVGKIEANDNDGDTVFSNWEIVSGDENNEFDINSDGEIMTNGSINHEGEAVYTLEIQVSDGELTSDVGEVSIEINDINERPYPNDNIIDLFIDEGFTIHKVALGGLFSDQDEGYVLTFSASSLDESIVAVSISNDTLFIEEKGIGETTIEIDANDGELDSETIELNMKINSTNQAPVIINQIQDLVLGPGFNKDTINLTTYFLDPDSDDLNFTSVSSDGEIVSTTIINNLLILNEKGQGVATLTITATDPDDEFVSFEFDVIIKEIQEIIYNSHQTLTYGDSPFELDISTSSGLSPKLTVTTGTGLVTITGKEVSILGAGSVTILAEQEGDENYAPAQPLEISLDIAKAPLSVTAQNQAITFGDPFPELTLSYSGFVNGEDASVLDEEPQASTTAGPDADAGTYPVTLSGGSDDNYTFSFTEGTLTIGQAAQTITFEEIPDVDIASQTSVSLSASASSGLEVTYTLIEGDGTIEGNTLTVNTTSTFTVEAAQAGNTNYLPAESVTQSFRVTDSRKDTQSITFDPVTEAFYGDQISLSATATSGLEVAYLLISGEGSIENEVLTLTGTGTYEVRASQSGNEAFNPAEPVTISFEAGKAPLTVTATDQAITEGDPMPELAMSFDGFKLGDDASVIDELPAIATEATAQSPAGNYEITLSGGSDDHYDLSLANGTLVIHEAEDQQEVLSLDPEGVEVTVYPNPFTDRITIESGGSFEVHLHSINGSLIRTSKGTAVIEMELGDLSTGSYLVKILTDEQVETKRIIKQ